METLNKIPTLDYIKKKYPTVKTVLFDMDGTLLDAEDFHTDAILELAGDHLNRDRLHEMSVGKTDDVLLRELQSIGFLDGLDYPQFSSLKFGNMVKIIDDIGLTLVPSMLMLIKEIKKSNFKLGLVTSSERILTEYIFKSLNLNQYFDLIITRNDVTKTKPDPYPYNMAMSALQSKPSETLIFEDSQTGLISARDSLAHVIEVKWFA